MSHTAKLFDAEGSQAVKLPSEFRLDAKEVSVRRDENTGEIILSPRPTWKAIFDMLDETEIPEDFLSPQERNQEPSQEREEI